jgi:hypothetical protein
MPGNVLEGKRYSEYFLNYDHKSQITASFAHSPSIMRAAANILGGNDTATFTSVDDRSLTTKKQMVELDKTNVSAIYSSKESDTYDPSKQNSDKRVSVNIQASCQSIEDN